MKVSEALYQLEQNQVRIQSVKPDRIRLGLQDRDLEQMRAALVLGPRGTGKTTLLLDACRKERLLYVPADFPLVARFGIWEIAEEAFRCGYSGVAVDEVHFVRSWSQDLKAVYDSYPRAKIYASDSSSLVLRKGIADLSRRFPRVKVPLLSFREFIHLKTGEVPPKFSFLETTDPCFEILQQVNVLRLFREYLEVGFRPIFLEGEYHARLLDIVEKTIFFDIPFLLPQVQDRYLTVLNAIMGYLATSRKPSLNIESLSREWSIGKDKLYELLTALEHVELISIVRYKSDVKAAGKGAKIFFSDPTFYAALGGHVGNVRESFVACMMRQSGGLIYACKDERSGDFVVNDMVLEIGGKNKKRKQAQFVIRDDIESPSRDVIPLWALGFLY